MRLLLFGTALMLAQGAANAAVIDGSLGGDPYGTALFVQDSPTSFGDNSNPSALEANGSEIDGVFGFISGGNLNLLVTGNVETNFNKLTLYIDSVPGGQTTLDGSTGGFFNSYSGTTFDSSFDADYGIIVNGGNAGTEFFMDFGVVGTSSSFLGGSGVGNQTIAGSNGINFGYDNSNILGVTGSSIVGADLVTTGFEFSIPLSVIGNPTGPIQVTGFIGGSGNGFISSQVFGGGLNGSNAGEAPDFSQIQGDQFVTIANPVPEPSTIALCGLGLAAMGLFVKKRK